MRVFPGNLVIVLVFVLSVQPVNADGTGFGPSEKTTALLKQPNNVYTFILRAEAGRTEAVAGMLEKDDPTELTLINGWAADLSVGRARNLSLNPDIRQVWYLHPNEAKIYVATIKALQYAVFESNGPMTANISMGPPVDRYTRKQDSDDPFHVATLRAAEAGVIPIIAAGNAGSSNGKNDGLINPWCLPVWVICVGASDIRGEHLWAQSSRGLRDDPETWPDVVAHGINTIGLWQSDKPKPPSRQKSDESNPVFVQSVPKEEWGKFTIRTGTSYAAPIVSRAASQIIYFMLELIERRDPLSEGNGLFELTVPRARIEFTEASGTRLTGKLVDSGEESVAIIYSWDQPWKLVKQLLKDTALPMREYASHQVGAGFVSGPYVAEQFGQFGLVNPQIMPLKVTK